MRVLAVLFIVLLLAVAPARADAVTKAVNEALAAFHVARPQLGAHFMGVELEAYGDALSSGRFASRHWGGQVRLELHDSRDADGACSRYAAYVALPPRNGLIRLTLCPQFSVEGTAALRRLTILHEMVHVVAGADECRAMAFAAHVEQLATGAFTPVERYWQANGCAGSDFLLP